MRISMWVRSSRSRIESDMGGVGGRNSYSHEVPILIQTWVLSGVSNRSKVYVSI